MNQLISNGTTPLTVFQLHYTSCRFGLSGHAGFQTRAMSNDIQPDEQLAIERLGIYHAPRDCPVEPDLQQIKEQFPSAYRNIFMKDGRLALARSVYVGKDYSNRWGNYFCHAILIEEMPQNVWPVDLYEWKEWKNKLEEEEDIFQDTYELKKITLVPDKTAFSFAELKEFLTEEDNRQDLLTKMIQAAMLSNTTSKNLVIREQLETNGLFWIACIQKSFPSAFQQNLTCSSYQFDPRACLAVNVIIGETDFSLGENERKFQFYVFDLLDQVYSNVEDSESEYATTISSWMCEYPEKLESFHIFSNQFDHDTIDNELFLVLRLFRISTDENLSLSDEELMDILGFVNSHTKKEFFESVRLIIASSINQLAKSENPEYISELVMFFITSASVTNNSDFRILAYELIIRLFDYVMFEKAYSFDKLANLRSNAKSAFECYDIEFSKLFLSDQHLATIYSKNNSLDTDYLLIVLNELISSVRFVSDNKDLLEDERIQQFIKRRLFSELPDFSDSSWLFEAFGDTSESYAKICIYVCHTLKTWVDDDNTIIDKDYDPAIDSLGSLLASQFQSKNNEFCFRIINLIMQNSATWTLLLEEWKCRISKESDKIVFHQCYFDQVLQKDSEFSRQFRPEFAEEIWKILSTKEKFSQALIWIESDETKNFPRPHLKNVFQTASEGISFKKDNPDLDKLTKLIANKIKDFNINLEPDRLVLREAVLLMNDNIAIFDKNLVMNIKKALVGIDERSYSEFTTAYLPSILAKVKNSEEHGVVIKFILIREFKKIFLKSYQRFFDQGQPNQFNVTEMAALNFWISLTRKDENYEIFSDIRDTSLDLLASRIARLKMGSFKALMNKTDADETIAGDRKIELNQIYQLVDDKINSLPRRILRTTSDCLQKLSKRFKK